MSGIDQRIVDQDLRERIGRENDEFDRAALAAGFSREDVVLLYRLGRHVTQQTAGLAARFFPVPKRMDAVGFVLRFVSETLANAKLGVEVYGVPGTIAACEAITADRKPDAEGKDWPHG